MMILKYKLDKGAITDISMPRDAEILNVQNQNDCVTLWVSVDTPPDFRKVSESRKFVIVPTGVEYDTSECDYKYVGTVQVGIFVWHVFEMVTL